MRTHALVGAVAVLAGAAVHAGSGVALVDVVLTVAASEAGRAQACERVDAIHARAAIETGAASKNAQVWKTVHGQNRGGKLLTD